MRQRFLNGLARLAVRRAQRRPYTHLRGYMERYWLLGGSYRDDRTVGERGWVGSGIDRWVGRWLAIRVHKILRSDLDRHLHDHPWACVSVVLVGTYWEVLPREAQQPSSLDSTHQLWRRRGPGAVVFRRPRSRHRLVLADGQAVWSLFIVGPKRNEWGFYTGKGKVHWRRYMGTASRRSHHEITCRAH